MNVKSRLHNLSARLWPKTLKNRLFIILSFNVLIPLLMVILISYKSVYPLLDQRIRTGIQNNLNMYQMSLENTLVSINNVSQILAYDGRIGKKLSLFLAEQDIYTKTQINNDILQDLNIISSTNPTLGLFFYYFEDKKQMLYQNYNVRDEFSLEKLPRLVELNGITYYGPHLTNRQYSDVQVLSVARKIVMPDQNNVYVYLESGYKVWDKIKQTGQEESMAHYHLIVDRENHITYSENKMDFPIGSMLYDDPVESSGKLKEANGYYVFETVSNQGWKAVDLISKSDYYKEVRRWFEQLVMIVILSMLLCSLFAWSIWRMVYFPLKRVNQDMQQLENFNTPLSRFEMVEFDTMMRHFDAMRNRVKELIQENLMKEKRRADFEVEKLLYQINPHFIHNTLDTIQWLARLKGQEDIDSVATSLNKLLYYNLGKKGAQSTIAEELEALKDYLTLQKVRYDFEFSVAIQADEELQTCLVPRFILQPLVENSLYHGDLDSNGLVEVTVEPDGPGYICIRISDNGRGMTPETIARLLEKQSEEQTKIGLGIGVYYVKRVFDSHYNGQAAFHISSQIGEGTCITLRIPRMLSAKEGGSE